MLLTHSIIYLVQCNRLAKGGVNCPEVVLLRKHVLVMSFIGTDHNPAPTLKQAKLTPSQLQSAYNQCIKVNSDRYCIHITSSSL